MHANPIFGETRSADRDPNRNRVKTVKNFGSTELNCGTDVAIGRFGSISTALSGEIHMRQMFPLLVCSFILINLLTGYLNAGPTAARTAVIRVDLKTVPEQWQTSRVSGTLIREDHVNQR